MRDKAPFFDTVMIDRDMMISFIRDLFRRRGPGTLSKEEVLAAVERSDIAESLPLFRQLPDNTDYTEGSLAGEMELIAKREGGGGAVFGRVGRGKRQ